MAFGRWFTRKRGRESQQNMTNLDERRPEEKKKILISRVRQLQEGENKNQLAASLSPDDEPSCQSSSDDGNMTN